MHVSLNLSGELLRNLNTAVITQLEWEKIFMQFRYIFNFAILSFVVSQSPALADFEVSTQDISKDTPLTVIPEACSTCKGITEADQKYGVPPNFSTFGFYTLTSANGGYYHRSDSTCDCFVGDIWMYKNSNLTPYPMGDPRKVVVSGHAYDLPSSSEAGGVVPTTAEDCSRYYRVVRMWERREGQDLFIEVLDQRSTGKWEHSECKIPDDKLIEVLPSSSNQARTLRVAVKVLLRDSAQKAQIKVTLPPPR